LFNLSTPSKPAFVNKSIAIPTKTHHSLKSIKGASPHSANHLSFLAFSYFGHPLIPCLSSVAIFLSHLDFSPSGRIR